MSSETRAYNGAQYCIALHGGAGVIERGALSEKQEREIRNSLESALKAGLAALTADTIICTCDSSVENLFKSDCACTNALAAVEAAVVALEESPWFNAGKGAVFTAEGTHELDASIMEGRNRRSGALGGVKRCRNPIKGARMVMDRTPHVFLIGDEADRFLADSGLEMVDNSWFDTELRLNQWNAALTGNPIAAAAHTRSRDVSNAGSTSVANSAASEGVMGEKKFGTVGAVAVDVKGNVAAATSTGGMTNKRFGRVGDSPVIGAGTWADNRFCAVSATGHGEYFIQNAVAHDISSRVRYLGETVEQACKEVVCHGDLKTDGGEGGVVAIDPKTRTAALVFNSPGMYRAWTDGQGNVHTAIYGDES
jgi:beta-aspartyl-peptidase (threonine type)